MSQSKSQNRFRFFNHLVRSGLRQVVEQVSKLSISRFLHGELEDVTSDILPIYKKKILGLRGVAAQYQLQSENKKMVK